MNSNFLYWNERPTKRIKVIENALKKDPFLYHKKKNVISSRFNDSNEEDSQNINQELLFCQDENSKQINKLKNNKITKSSTIDSNTKNYINYMIREKNENSTKKIMPTEPVSPINNYEIKIRNKRQINKYPHQESFTPNKYRYNNLSNIRNNSMENNISRLDPINCNNMINELNLGNKIKFSNSYKSLANDPFIYDENNNNNFPVVDNDNSRSNDFLPRMPSLKGTTDITDQNYYDKISKQLILQMNKNYMDYNQNIINRRYSPSGNKLLFLRNNKLAVPPGHISNPKYYNLGESRLKSNPIVNPGNRAPIFNHYNNHNHKIKSEFI